MAEGLRAASEARFVRVYNDRLQASVRSGAAPSFLFERGLFTPVPLPVHVLSALTTAVARKVRLRARSLSRMSHAWHASPFRAPV